ncbi:hypothetical protein G7K_1497-t1 [Saitoella complicata NRRL Y-17804]|uniref:Uncharacterized protein n=1 Tax=Saitoella complicata (strain BCRC 22490 / CBS 7301 / JCM 7358 / NBRC 10748 / NRRL Y-17804) TaxID=698492 RepID=A0A0E9NBN4_SAICN|nr:hypothetical protein G7K_1497-t1 [Saitoella complicata NRRL Y-17804]
MHLQIQLEETDDTSSELFLSQAYCIASGQSAGSLDVTHLQVYLLFSCPDSPFISASFGFSSTEQVPLLSVPKHQKVAIVYSSLTSTSRRRVRESIYI